MSRFFLRALLLIGTTTLSGLGMGALTGCGVDPRLDTNTTTLPASVAGFKIKGDVHGGAYPIQNATIRLMETTSNGVWSSSAKAYAGAARQILTTTSDSNGNFEFPDTGWNCTAGQYDYIEVNGGRTTGSSNNPNVVQVGVIGACSTYLANQAEIDAVDVYISELSTVAAAYALNNFISMSADSTGAPVVNITAPGSNNAVPKCSGLRDQEDGLTALSCKAAGLAHGFANSYNLVDQVSFTAGQFPTGQARTTVPGNSQALVPQAMINAIGNILQSCVDSGGGTVGSYSAYVPGGSSSTRCGDLFYDSTPAGSTTPPANTMQAALNIANSPSHNVATLFALQPRAVFFTPTMSSPYYNGTTTLVSFTVSIFYKGTGLSGDTTGIVNPVDVALDVQDNVYVAYSRASKTGALAELGANGTGLFVSTPSTPIQNPGSIAVDGNGYVWVTDNAASQGGVTGFYTSVNATSGLLGSVYKTVAVPNGSAAGLAFDASADMFVTRSATTNSSDYFFTVSGGSYSMAFAGRSLGSPLTKAAVNSLGNFYGVGSTGSVTGFAAMIAQSFGTNYADTIVSISMTGGAPLAIDNTAANYTAYMPSANKVMTGNAYGSSASNLYAQSSTEGSYSETATSTQLTSPSPSGAALDGTRNLYWTDSSNGQVFFLTGTGGSTNISTGGTFGSFMPCHLTGGVCDNPGSAKLGGMAIDSSGAMWYVSAGGSYGLVQTLGQASPTWPLLASENSGVMVQ